MNMQMQPEQTPAPAMQIGVEAAVVPAEEHQYNQEPEADELARKWNNRIAAARTHWEKFHKRVKHNRKTVAGFDWKKNPDDDDFYKLRANLIHGTITAILPNIYARNPEMSVTGLHKGKPLKLFCETLQTVTNRELDRARLKTRAKATVRAALTVSFGVVKVMYQRDIKQDPIIAARINDTQDNIQRVEKLLMDLQDPDQRADEEATKAELEETLRALQEQVEVVAAEGLVIDRLLTEQILLDPTLAELQDYADSDWMIQIIPMKKSLAESMYKYKLDKAKRYRDTATPARADSNRILSGGDDKAGEDDCQIAIMEIWDKRSQTVYTLAEGCDWWLREPYSPPKAGERWYPFFILPFQLVDGEVIGPSLVDLTEKLQAEHNGARNKFNQHRELCEPGWIASSDINAKTVTRYRDATLGEITIVDVEGRPLNQVIVPKQHPPIDPAVYDTSAVRFDWEQVTGMQDAARSTVVQAKTATEASIQQQALSGRVSEFRDQVEDFLQDISQYAAQILVMELTPAQVERIMGGPTTETVPSPAPGMPAMQVPVPSYDWPELSRDQVFEMIELKIRAGTTGEPNQIEQQEIWIKLMPVIQPLITQMMQGKAAGMDTSPLEALLRETITRFDEKLDWEQFIPQAPAMPPAPALPPGAAAPAPAVQPQGA
ncbi:hypothetical protein [Ensifer sp. SSB1]|uniref:hypothetical protein n=1 Tax=Ensifer sp. SSB1 TaxID=2795385 RepID=UPI001A3C6296|nr:hypothetical protein [Ensifer sp. SSB1]MBK5570108.1 hypothetical protein [Ensifer sp. SSB1]